MAKASDASADRFAIRELIENWAMWRDAGQWDRLASLWHPDGRMIATWFQASAVDFIARSRAAWDQGMNVAHVLGGSTIEVVGSRATSETRMQIVQRAVVENVEVEVTCLGRFLDAFARDETGWRLVLRQLAYEMDRMTPIDPSENLRLDKDLLASFPDGYRHLAYLQTRQGHDVVKTLPGGRGPKIDAVRARARRWLAGEAADCLLPEAETRIGESRMPDTPEVFLSAAVNR